MRSYKLKVKIFSKIDIYNSENDDIGLNKLVVINTERGLQIAKVIMIYDDLIETENYILRIATKKDIITDENNTKDAEEALKSAKNIAKKLGLKMKFIESFFTLDRNQLLITFTAENRVDFRELAKQLASIYKTRIELRQIGVRDEARKISGLGLCGRELCCSCFLNDLDSVTINMAKNQNLSLNPTKINGLCGRLLCCLKYEDNLYKENQVDMPKIGDIVATEMGDGEVVWIDIPQRKFVVNVKDSGTVEISLLNSVNKDDKDSK